MSLVGKTTIKLFDSKTGELSDIVESKNMVTNAVSNIFNGFLNAVALSDNNGIGRHNNLNYLFDIPDGYNLAKTFFGGLLIFSNAIEEDVDHIIPTIDEMKTFVGCGNQGAGVTGNVFKGALNDSESEVGNDYVKFVWDFTTEQCNGDIASICLTSDLGGSQGYKFSAITSNIEAHSMAFISNAMWDTSKSIDFNSSYIHNPMFKSSFTSPNAHGSYIDGNYFYYVYRDAVYKYDISRLLNKIGINIQEAFDYGAPSTYDELIRLSLGLTGVFNCLDDDKVYEYNVNQSDASVFTLVKISGNAVTTSISIPTTNILASLSEYLNYDFSYFRAIAGWSVIYEDKIYTLVGWINNSDLTTKPNKLRVYILSFDGTFTYKDVNVTDNMISMLFGTKVYTGNANDPGTKFNKIFDTLVLESSDTTNGYKYYMVDEDGTISSYPFMSCKNSLYYYGNALYKNLDWLKEPWCSFKFAGNGMLNSIELWSTYLATINNQDVVLTKTADKTMKIIYTLTQS